MSGLVIVVASADPERLRTALVMAAAHAALDGTARLFLQGESVGLLRLPIADPDAARQSAAGLPTLAELVDEAFDLGAVIGACQSSLALLGHSAEDYDPAIEWGGMVGLLARLAPTDRLVVV